jgi:alkylation response protein AidB-like acyl-CoA dehydrogenase
MLFSEPSGGSDLAALRTVARRDGDHYVVKGHKIWTSLAHKAKVGVLVARTHPDLPKHQGLTQFLVDMDTPGITIRPIVDLSGEENEYNEVFLDEVRIPADRLLGKEGEGWTLSTTQLQTERVALSRPGAIWGHGPSARELVEGLAEIGALDDSGLRDDAAEIYIEGEILRLLAMKSLSDRMNARTPGPEGAIHKMLAAPHGQKVVELAKRAQGARGMIAGEQPFPSQLGGKGTFDDWDYAFWFSPAVTLGVGTQEVLKNVVAERMLGLPRDVDPTARMPWSEARRKASQA